MFDRIYCVYDLKAKLLVGQPFFQPNDAVARRSFAEFVRNPETNANRYPDDHILVCICSIEAAGPDDFMAVGNAESSNGARLYCGTRNPILTAREVVDADAQAARRAAVDAQRPIVREVNLEDDVQLATEGQVSAL